MADTNKRTGFRYYDEGGHYTISALENWLPHLVEFSAHWLVLPTSASEIVPEAFLQAVQEANMQPIIHVVAPIGSLSDGEIRRVLNAYARYGVHAVVIYDKPNNQASWPEGTWTDGDLIGAFMDIMIPIWNTQAEMGMSPMFPPLSPGGDYWDTAFLEAALVSLTQRGHSQLLQSMKLAAYAWSYGRALNWGEGGPARWPQAVAYHTPEASQNHQGMQIFDWYEAITSQAIEIALPIIVVAGGSTIDDETRPSETAEILRMLEGDEISSSVEAFAFPLFARKSDEMQSMAAWQVAEVAKERPQIKSPDLPIAKLYNDYILLPQEVASTAWPKIAQFAQARECSLGFSSHEAAQAERVWILADENQISDSIEQELVESGCQVSRKVAEMDTTARSSA